MNGDPIMTRTAKGPETPLSAPHLREVVASVDHLRKVQRVTDATLANLPVDALLDELLIRVREALEADTAAILLLDKSRGELVARAAKGLEEEVEQGARIPLGRGFAGRIAATGAPVILDRVTDKNVVNPILLQKGIRSLLGVPLVVQGETLGVLHVGTLTPRKFTEEDSELLQVVGDRVGLAIHVSLYERQRAVARTLQRSLLPGRLPSLPGLALAARYEPARGGEVGGDWYDAFTLPGGVLGVAIGDVVGRGLEAATVMGRVRNALRAYAIDMSSPGEVLQRLDRLFQHLHPEEMATALYGTLDPVDLTFSFASAGHMPPVIRRPDGSAQVLKVEGSPPIGATFGRSFAEHTEALEPGSTLVLFTDGLVERRTGTLDDGLGRLSELCRADLPPQERCDMILDELLGDEDDDVALLVIEIAQDLGDSWHLTLPADPKQPRILRRVLERWLGARSASKELMGDVLAGTGEAVANAIQHAYGPSGGAVEIEAEWLGDRIVIRIHDIGRWRPARDPDRGRGIPIMEALSDGVQVSRSEEGTSVELRWNVEG
jgi:anti-sigma regulatory factor (Ser/Thr protein kinase)/putative methionine-R-sulfoxide reductase with GAF domain